MSFLKNALVSLGIGAASVDAVLSAENVRADLKDKLAQLIRQHG